METWGDPPQALHSGIFHCDNSSGLLLRPGVQSSPEAAGIGKEVVFPARSKGTGGSCLDTSRPEERRVRFLGVCPSLLLDCLPYRAILPFSLTLQGGSWFFWCGVVISQRPVMQQPRFNLVSGTVFTKFYPFSPNCSCTMLSWEVQVQLVQCPPHPHTDPQGPSDTPTDTNMFAHH